MTNKLKYIAHYPAAVLEQVQALIDRQQLGEVLIQRYPTAHDITTAKALYQYAMAVKNRYLRQSPPLDKVLFDDKIHVIRDALGLHSSVSRVQGSKLKAKYEIRVSTLFKRAPLAFLNLIVVHELAHFKQKEHNKAFYQLCQHMEPDYYQLEFDLRLYLTYLDFAEPLY